ncbi:MAG: hypothetical protein JSU96_03415 [Acidobacteriota bacterium]|nr:MAG: hypothetical protein JSU96_03415 [Acidobacteriota bacterium]
MRLAAGTVFVYAWVILAAAILAFKGSGGVISLVSGILAGAGLVTGGVLALRNVTGAAYGSGVLTFLLAIYFAYRFLATERFLPSGVLLIVSFVALFLILVGIFIGLSKEKA